MTDNNVFDSSTGPLGAGATWRSDWMDMRGFQAVTAVLTGDEIIAEARFEWSHDASVVQLSQVWLENVNPISFGGAATSGVTPQAQFVRLVVVNGGNAQGPTWRALVSLMQAPPTGFVAPLVAFPRDSDSGQTSRAVMFGRRVGSVDPQYTQVLVDGGGELITSDGPLPTTAFGQRIPATLTSTLVTSFFPEERSSLTIHNSSTSGNMYVRLALDVDLAFDEWDYEVLPGWLWVCPRWGGDVYIAWDDASDGFAHCSEVTG